MGLVRMDVDEVAAIIASLRDVLETCFDEWSDVGSASSRALHSCDAMSSALSTHLPALSDLALDLQRRRDLAILLNSDGGSMPTGVLEYTAPGDDSSAAVTAALGRAMADFARRDAASEDPEAMAALEAMLDTYSGQPEVLSAFYTELGPAGLLDVMASLSGPYTEFGSDEYNQRASLLAEIKSGFATAERTWGDAATAQYAKDLVDLASGTVNRPSSYPFGFGGALSYLLYDSNYSDAFLTSAASQIDHHERTTFGGYSSSGFNWTSGGGPNPWYAYFPENGQVGSYDLGVSLMSALGNNAEVGLDFFMDGGSGSEAERLTYWLREREWEQDQFSHLSQALLAATTDPRLIEPWDSDSALQAATLASYTVNLLGSRDGISPGLLGESEGTGDAADNFARILGTYLTAVDRGLFRRTDTEAGTGSAMEKTELFFGAGDFGPVPLFNRDALEKFIALSSSTDEGIVTLRLAVDSYATSKYDVAMGAFAGLGEDASAQERAIADRNLQIAFESQAYLEGLFVKAVGESAIAEARGADEVRTAWIKLGSDLVGLIPVGGMVARAGGDKLVQTVATFTVAQVNSAVKGQATEAWASLEDAETADQTGQAELNRRLAQYSALLALERNGLMPDSGGPPIDPEAFRALDATEAEAEFDRLVDVDTGAGVLFNETLVGQTYDSAFFDYYPKK